MIFLFFVTKSNRKRACLSRCRDVCLFRETAVPAQPLLGSVERECVGLMKLKKSYRERKTTSINFQPLTFRTKKDLKLELKTKTNLKRFFSGTRVVFFLFFTGKKAITHSNGQSYKAKLMTSLLVYQACKSSCVIPVTVC